MNKWGKYVFVLLITVGLFAVSWYASFYFNQQRITDIRNIEQQVATDLLSSETDYSLLQELSCDDINQSITTEQLGSLASRISFTDENIGNEQTDVLKKQYMILEVKDFLLQKRIAERCKTPIVSVLYFYGTGDKCTDCTKQGYVLDAAREKYSNLRIYSFDYNLDLSTIKAMKSIYKVNGALPALVVNNKSYTGFKTLEQLEALLPKEFVKSAADKAAAEAKNSMNSTNTTKATTTTTNGQ